MRSSSTTISNSKKMMLRNNYETYVKQEIFNFKVERIVGIEKEKEEFDDEYKESIIEYLNNNSYKDKSNTGTVIGKLRGLISKP